jgi:hypothetical protein
MPEAVMPEAVMPRGRKAASVKLTVARESLSQMN